MEARSTMPDLQRMSERAQDLAQDVRGQVEEWIGDSIERWPAEVRRYVRDHPLQALALTVGIGFLLGKVFIGRRS